MINVDDYGKSTGEIKNNDEVIKVKYRFLSNTVAKLMFVQAEKEDGYFKELDEITIERVDS